MKLIFQNLRENLITLARKIGYAPKGQRGNEFEMIRLISGASYPRFHIYAKLDKKTMTFALNLHLDQKKTSYKGSSAHSGEYSEGVVKREAERIKSILKTSQPEKSDRYF